jgi:hypothetical protein
VVRDDGRVSRDPMVEGGEIVSSPDGSLWCVVALDDERVVLRRCDNEGVLIGIQRGGERREVSWDEWATGWELKSP